MYLRVSHLLPNHMPPSDLSILGIANLKFEIWFFFCFFLFHYLFGGDTMNVPAVSVDTGHVRCGSAIVCKKFAMARRNVKLYVYMLLTIRQIRFFLFFVWFTIKIYGRDFFFISFRFVWIHISTQILVHSSFFLHLPPNLFDLIERHVNVNKFSSFIVPRRFFFLLIHSLSN